MRPETKVWLEQALKDEDSAKKNLKMEEYHLVVFLCQQAVEKALKALFIEKKNETSGMTHSLVYLASEVGLPKKFFSFLRGLTPAFVNTRYPDAAYGLPYTLYDKPMAENTLSATREVLKWIESQIKK
ncbi:MAG: HEPN domain-containing protein [Nanoarchaeota archaeon]|nr:HEPN domain-containing protein [Nanoarchaeota archaeon]